VQGAATQEADGRVGLEVVPDEPDRLLECPGLAPFPRQVPAPEVVAKHLPRAGLENAPSTHQIEGGISWRHTADVDDPGQAAVGDEHVWQDQVTVGHDVLRGAWQHPQGRPGAAERRHIEQVFTARQRSAINREAVSSAR